MRRLAGFSLWELIFAVALAAVVLGLGIPSLQRFVLDSRLTADVNAFVAAVQLARSEAAKRARSVIVCKTTDHASCGGDEIRYDAGWMVFVNEDDRWPPTRSAAEPLLRVHVPVIDGSIVSNRPLYEFRAYRRRSTNGTVTFCDARGPAAARAVIISYTGRPRVAAVGPGDRELSCAGLP
jgi:type IV fimbrial biogenesis protein FimT